MGPVMLAEPSAAPLFERVMSGKHVSCQIVEEIAEAMWLVMAFAHLWKLPTNSR